MRLHLALLNGQVDVSKLELQRHRVSLVRERRAGQRNVVTVVGGRGREVVFAVEVSQRQELADASNGDPRFDDAVDDPGEGVERPGEHREQRHGRENFGSGQLVAQESVHSERDDGDKDRRRGPQVDANGVEILPAFEVVEFFRPVRVNATGKEIFPDEKLDHPDAGQKLGHHLDPLVLRGHHLLTEIPDSVGDQLVDGDEQDGDGDSGEARQADLLVEKQKGDAELEGKAP